MAPSTPARCLMYMASALNLLHEAHCFQSFQLEIPNGDLVKDVNGTLWPAVGHYTRRGWDGGRNLFGQDFKAADLKWTKELCEKDSDGDGQTNGYELGDPDCDWSMGKTPRRLVNISHPGQASSTTPLYPLHYGDTVVLKCKVDETFLGSDESGLMKAGKTRPMAMQFRLEGRDSNMTGENITSGSEVYIYAWNSDTHLTVQNSSGTTPDETPGITHHHWDHTGTWEVFTIEKYLGGIIYDDDQVSFRAHTGNLLMVEDSEYLTANTTGWQRSMNFYVQAVLFEEGSV